MSYSQQIIFVRFAFSALAAVLIYFTSMPAFNDLKQIDAHLTRLYPHASWVDAEFTTSDGVILKCSGKKTAKTCPYEVLLLVKSTNETMTVWHDGKKAWQAVTPSQGKIIDFEVISWSYGILRWMLLPLFGLVIIFSPRLIRN